MSDVTVPLKERPLDWFIVGFFVINIVFITYLVDIEQLVVTNTSDFEYPIWPPKWLVDAAHWFGATYDPLLLARPLWWRMTIWIDVVLFGPFYVAAIFAYSKGKPWIRIPSIIYASVLLTNVTIILGEEIAGPHASSDLGMVLFANASWIIFPILIIYRMWRDPTPFRRS